MSIRTPSRSIFRPERQIDRAILHEHKALIEKINRRKVLARYLEPWRADVVDGLRRQRKRSGADCAARGFRLERSRAGIDFPAQSPGADISRVAGGEAAAFQRLLWHR